MTDIDTTTALQMPCKHFIGKDQAERQAEERGVVHCPVDGSDHPLSDLVERAPLSQEDRPEPAPLPVEDEAAMIDLYDAEQARILGFITVEDYRAKHGTATIEQVREARAAEAAAKPVPVLPPEEKKTRPAASSGTSGRSTGKMTRKDAVAALREAGYTGPVSYPMPKVLELVAQHVKQG